MGGGDKRSNGTRRSDSTAVTDAFVGARQLRELDELEMAVLCGMAYSRRATNLDWLRV